MKIETTPDIVNRIRAYAEAFSADRPAVLSLFTTTSRDALQSSLFSFAADSDRGLGILLLAASLHRPGMLQRVASPVGVGEPGSVADSADLVDERKTREPAGEDLTGFGASAAFLIAGLYRTYGNDIFRLNRLPFDTLRARTDGLAEEWGGWEDADRARIPGILRSVCDFFYRVGPLVSWLADADWEQRAGEIAQEIYWMGARSPTRTKARLFFWLACQIPGFGLRDDMRPHAVHFTWPVSDGHMRVLFDILKPARGDISSLRAPSMRGQAFAELSRLVFPDEPWRLYLPFEAFLCPDGRGGFLCRAAQGGCRSCALSSLCPAAPNFLPRER